VDNEKNEYGLPWAVRMYHCPRCGYTGTMAQAIYEDGRKCGDCHLEKVAHGVRLTKAERDWYAGIYDAWASRT
jgi:ribosomal protein S27AE